MLDLDLIFVFPPLFFNISEWIFIFFLLISILVNGVPSGFFDGSRGLL